MRGLIKGKPNDRNGFGDVVYVMMVTNVADVSDPSRGGHLQKENRGTRRIPRRN
jgi:hypothetical protein